MVSGIRPPSPMWPRCACAAPAAAIRVRARRVRFIVVMVGLMAVMACWMIAIWAQQRHQQVSPSAAAPRTTAFKASLLDYDVAATPRRLQVGTGVGVDFHADSDFDDTRCFPGHDVSPFGGMNMLRNLWMDSI
jgi:hypothetical protein